MPAINEAHLLYTPRFADLMERKAAEFQAKADNIDPAYSGWVKRDWIGHAADYRNRAVDARRRYAAGDQTLNLAGVEARRAARS